MRGLMSTTARTIQEVAEYRNVDPERACRMIKRRGLPGFKGGGGWWFRREEIDDSGAEQKEAAVWRDEEER